MTTDDTTARLAEIRRKLFEKGGIVSLEEDIWLIEQLTDALERERVLIENVARLAEALNTFLDHIPDWKIKGDRNFIIYSEWVRPLKKLLAEIEGGE